MPRDWTDEDRWDYADIQHDEAVDRELDDARGRHPSPAPMGRRLHWSVVNRLAHRTWHGRIAVENFLGTLRSGDGMGAALGNLYHDARLYAWTPATIEAIREGIRILFEGGGDGQTVDA